MNTAQISRPAPKVESSAMKAVETVIAEHPFLKGLKPEHIRLLTSCAMRMQFKENDLIFREADPANRFYLIETGKVSLEVPRLDQPGVPIQTIGPGEPVGWSWLYPPYYWHFDAVAIEPTTAIFFYGTRLRDACEEDHDLGFELMKRMTQVVIQRLQATRKQLVEASR